MTKETEALLTIAQVVVRMRTKDQRPANRLDCNRGVNSAADLFEANGLTTTPEQRVEVHTELMRRHAVPPTFNKAACEPA
jgi:hypothetical protein